MKSGIYLILFVLLLSSCFPEDNVYEPIELTNQIGIVDLYSRDNQDYQDQSYYDFGTNQVLTSYKRTAWDLGFSCSEGDFNIFTNPSIQMRIAITHKKDFDDLYDPSQYKFEHARVDKFLKNSWAYSYLINEDSFSTVFIVDLGRTLENRPRGYKKIQITERNDEYYKLKIAEVDETGGIEYQINRNSDFHNVFISIEKADSVLLLEPPKQNWDLFFTRYMERLPLEEDTLDYSVTGALLNPNFVEAIEIQDSTLSFDDLSRENISLNALSSRTSTIGHDWKYFLLDESIYIIENSRYYIIRDTENNFYKLRFLNFYDGDGNKGYCQFEFLRI